MRAVVRLRPIFLPPEMCSTPYRTMETMATSFSSRIPAQLDTIIFYSGPPSKSDDDARPPGGMVARLGEQLPPAAPNSRSSCRSTGGNTVRAVGRAGQDPQSRAWAVAVDDKIPVVTASPPRASPAVTSCNSSDRPKDLWGGIDNTGGANPFELPPLNTSETMDFSTWLCRAEAMDGALGATTSLDLGMPLSSEGVAVSCLPNEHENLGSSSPRRSTPQKDWRNGCEVRHTDNTVPSATIDAAINADARQPSDELFSNASNGTGAVNQDAESQHTCNGKLELQELPERIVASPSDADSAAAEQGRPKPNHCVHSTDETYPQDKMRNNVSDSTDEDVPFIPRPPKRLDRLQSSGHESESKSSGAASFGYGARTRNRHHYQCRPRIPSLRERGTQTRARSRRANRANRAAAAIAQREAHSLSPGLSTEDVPTWAVDCIVSSTRKRGKVFYKVIWKPTWEPAESLQGTAETAIAEFRGRKLR